MADCTTYDTSKFPKPEELFSEYGGGVDGIDREEFENMLSDIDGFGILGEMDSRMLCRVQRYVDTEFNSADLNHDGVIDADEFLLYYYREICFKFPVGKNGYNPGATLYNIFCNYCSVGKGGRRHEEMEAHQLLKLCRECGLLDSARCRKADIDLVFRRARAEAVYARERGATKLQYAQFLDALMLIAEKRLTGFQEVVTNIRQYGKIIRSPSVADFLVMGDPRGVVEDSKDLERPRGLPKLSNSHLKAILGDNGGSLRQLGAIYPSAAKRIGIGLQGEKMYSPTWHQIEPGDEMLTTKEDYQFDLDDYECGQWEPVAQEPCLQATGDAGTGCIEHDQSLSDSTLHVKSGKFQSVGRCTWHFQKLARAFYDSAENQRITQVIANPAISSFVQAVCAKRAARRSKASNRTAVLHDSEAMHRVRVSKEEQLTITLKYVFEQFCKWEGGVNSSRMDKPRFHKVLRDAELVQSGKLNSQQVDSIFFRVTPPSKKTVNFVQFLEGLRYCAVFTRMSLNEVVHRIVAIGGPVPNVSY